MSARSDMLRVKKVPLFIQRTPYNDVWVVERVTIFIRHKYAFNEPVHGYSAFHGVAPLPDSTNLSMHALRVCSSLPACTQGLAVEA